MELVAQDQGAKLSGASGLQPDLISEADMLWKIIYDEKVGPKACYKRGLNKWGRGE